MNPEREPEVRPAAEARGSSPSVGQATPAGGARAGVRRSLRGHGFQEQTAMLSPRGAVSPPGGSAAAASPGGSAAAAAGGAHPMLRVGSRGPAVARLQGRLASQGASVTADGVFGPQTRQAVVAFQRSRALSPDGVVGPQTWGALEGGGGTGATTVHGAAGGAAAGGAGAAGASATRMASIQAKLGTVRERFAALAEAGRQSAAGTGGPVPTAPTGPEAAAAAPAPRQGWLDDVGDAAGDAWDTATDVAGDAMDTAKAGAQEVWDTATDVAGDAMDTAKDVAGGAWDTAKDVAGNAWDTAKDVAGNAWDTAKDVAGGVADAAEGGYGGTGGVTPQAWDDLKGVADEVRSGVEGLVSDLGERYADEIEILRRALEDLGRPLTVDLGAVEAALDGLLDGLDPGAATGQVKVEPPPPPDPVATDYAFTVTQPPKTQTTRLSGETLEKLKVATESASKAQAGGGAQFLFVQPAPFKTSAKKTDKYGRVTGLKVQTQETLGIPSWAEHDANPDAWHPKARESWGTAKQGMDVHEAEHVRRDQAAYTAQAVQDKVHGKPQSEIGTALNQIEAQAKADSDSWDSNTEHGVMGTPSTVVRIPHFQVVEDWNREHPADKDKKL